MIYTLTMFTIIFSKFNYTILAAIISVSIFISLSVISEYIFFEPYFIIHIPTDRLIGFVLIIGVSIMSGLVVSMNVYRIKKLQTNMKKMKGGFLGLIIGASGGACSCGPIGFAMISTFGTVGGIATSFLTNYEVPLRLVALVVLCYTYYATTKAISYECKIRN